MKRLIFVLLFLISSFAKAELSIQLDSASVALGQSFRLVLTSDVASSGIPDLTPLQADFKIMGTERSTNYSIVNGQSSSTSQWAVMLVPKRTGKLAIPPIQVGSEQTAATSIEVTGGSATQENSSPATQSKDIMLYATVNNDHPYVNEQVIYTVKLYNSRQLLDANYQAPSVENALLIPLGDSRHYQTSVNGRIYSVEEQQYALFPQKSGELKVVSPTFKAMVFDEVPGEVNVTAEPVRLQVKPALATIKGNNWLPARGVELTEHYDRSSTTLAQGSTLIRTITLKVVGLPAQLLPTLGFASNDKFSIYPEKPTVANKLSQSELIGTSTVKVTYLLNQAGSIVIPAFQLHWFNTETGKEEIASLPELALNVTPVATAPLNQGNQLASQGTSSSTQIVVKDINTTPSSTSTGQNSIAWWLAGGFALAWLITLALGWGGRRKPSNKRSRRQVERELKEACLSNQVELARVALLRWASFQWPDITLLNLAEINKLTQDSGLNHAINELSKALYHAPGSETWRGEALWRAISNFKKTPSAKTKQDKPLPPINPS